MLFVTNLVIVFTATLPSMEATHRAIIIIQIPQYILAAKKSKPYDRQKTNNASSRSNKGPVAPVIIIGCPETSAKNIPPTHVKTCLQNKKCESDIELVYIITESFHQ